MIKKCLKWAKYYKNYCAKVAKGLSAKENINYGREVYRSQRYGNSCWVVTEFEDEYNVFVEKFKLGTLNKIADKIHVQSFNWKESAIRFALEMLLVSNGRLTRRDKL